MSGPLCQHGIAVCGVCPLCREPIGPSVEGELVPLDGFDDRPGADDDEDDRRIDRMERLDYLREMEEDR